MLNMSTGTPLTAEAAHFDSTGSRPKIRNPLAVTLLCIFTAGIYLVFWWNFINREMADYGRVKGTRDLGDSPVKSTLALFPGCLVIVPAIWTSVTTFQRIQAAQRMTNLTPINGWIGLILYLVLPPALFAYMQSGLNPAWQQTAA
jgi:hypothetical protein